MLGRAVVYTLPTQLSPCQRRSATLPVQQPRSVGFTVTFSLLVAAQSGVFWSRFQLSRADSVVPNDSFLTSACANWR